MCLRDLIFLICFCVAFLILTVVVPTIILMKMTETLGRFVILPLLAFIVVYFAIKEWNEWMNSEY